MALVAIAIAAFATGMAFDQQLDRWLQRRQVKEVARQAGRASQERFVELPGAEMHLLAMCPKCRDPFWKRSEES